MRAVSCDWSRLTRAEKVASASTNRSAGGAARAVASRIVVLSPDLWPGVDQRCLQSGLHDAGVCASLKKSTRKFDFCVYAIEPHPIQYEAPKVIISAVLDIVAGIRQNGSQPASSSGTK